MTVDLRWLTAPEDEVAAAMATVRRTSRPSWVPTKRQVLLRVNHCLILWYLCIVFMVYGISVDSYHGGQATASDITGLFAAMAFLAVWLFGTYRMHVWAAKPPSPRARLKQWRQTLTALANGFEQQPLQAATFRSMITTGNPDVRAYPRFTASDVEFGNILRGANRSSGWQYIAIKLPAPLPHVILDATSNNRLGSDLPTTIDRGQRISLEGDFDSWFQAYSPVQYRQEALYVLTPDVMAALIDEASRFNVEIVDDFLVFFTSPSADFAEPEHWQSLDGILTNVAPRIIARARRYVDERVPGQEVPRALAAVRATLENPSEPWRPPTPRIGPDGRRLAVRERNGLLSLLGAVAWWVTSLLLLYLVPGTFAFAGFMSIVDGR
ncbi:MULTISPECIES: DUF3137 domain-containing protein [unclassified Microbacterium]|uniref:DUF3137 domain-containing protein n=1 Tax=unclassified Microbacterium TaxID=2609290 RepID=UPI00214B3A2C|nr:MULTISPECIES: DUF3137 domain-containing protein [unclassified Microbacterium]MCR2784813.1 DUF3137 domain-containing protein [Microbacterium sp. zg.B96]WIM16351.1 DUF3137 domain-containing protein [Microbacterium sp. zg-B96]